MMSLRLAVAAAVAAWGITVPLALLAQQFDCAQAGSQNALTYCAEQDWIAAEADLNRVYRRVRALMQQIDAGRCQQIVLARGPEASSSLSASR